MNRKEITRKYIIIYYMVISILSLVSVFLHIIYSEKPLVTISKFTIQSNLFVGLIFLYNIIILLRYRTEIKYLHFFKNATLIYLIVICLTYHFILRSGNPVYNGPRIYTNIILHYIVPIMVLINWILFEEKRIYRYKTIMYWLVFPVLYSIISLVRGAIDGFYPYFFLNPNQRIPIGVGSYFNVMISITIFSLVLILFGFFVISINKLIVKFKINK